MIFYQFQNKKKEMKTFKEYNLDDKINRMVIDAIKAAIKDYKSKQVT